MNYTVDITETLSRGVSVEADTKEDAKAIVERAYKESEHVLDETDFCGVEFSIEDDDIPPIVTLDKGVDPRCLVLISDFNEAKTHEGRIAQTAHAAYIDGYITATGEFSRFLIHLWKTDNATASIVSQALKSLSRQQNASYDAMCKRLNDKASWDDSDEESP